MESHEDLLEFHVNRAIDAYVKAGRDQGKTMLPIDLHAVARAIGNIDIELREMIPEAAVQLENQRFKIYLQGNFLNRPGAARRQRFSLAHEIAHTFFFEVQEDSLKPAKGAPRGLHLEKACHQGARMLLIPERFLDREVKKVGERMRAPEVLRLAETFDVSVEVLLRRLQHHAALDSDGVAFALVRDGRIRFAGYPPWMKSIFSTPVIDGDFVQWLNSASAPVQSLEDGSFQIVVGDNVLSVNAARISGGRSLFEIRINRNAGEQLRFAV